MKKLNLLQLIGHRYYVVAFIEGNGCYTNFLTLETVLEDTKEEYKYAIHERIDDILKLEVGERLKMWFNRDNTTDSEGYIKRIEPTVK